MKKTMSIALALMSPEEPMFTFSLDTTLFGLGLFVYSYMFLFYYADRKDNNIRFSLRTLPVMFGGFAASSVVGVFNQVVGLLRWRDQLHWVKTEHAIDADDVQIRNIAPVHRKVKAA